MDTLDNLSLGATGTPRSASEAAQTGARAQEALRDPINRRTFLARMAAAGLGVAAASLIAGCSDSDNDGGPNVPGAVANTYPSALGAGDFRVLNYALTLEVLEADLYRQALNRATGRPLTDALLPIGQSGRYTLTVPSSGLSGSAQAAFLYLKQFTYVEAIHRDFLTAALGANAAPIVSANGYQFPNNEPGTTLGAIMRNIIPLEETGTRAYLGASVDIANAAFLGAAGTIYSTECRHSAAVRYIVNPSPEQVGPSRMMGDREVTPDPESELLFEKLLSVQEVLAAAQSTYFKPAAG